MRYISGEHGTASVTMFKYDVSPEGHRDDCEQKRTTCTTAYRYRLPETACYNAGMAVC